MKDNGKPSGVIIPQITPLTPEGDLDEAAAINITNRVIESGTHPFLLGTTGELPSMSVRMRRKLIQLISKHSNHKKILFAGISDNSMENVIEMSKRYADFEVDFLVVHLPSYFPLDDDQILKYFEFIAENVPLPMVIYNILSTTKMSISLENLDHLSQHQTIIGLKDSERDWERIKTIVNQFADRDDFSLFCGWGAKSVDALMLGFDGIVPNNGNLIPELYQKLYEKVRQGDREGTEVYQQRADKVAQIFQKDKGLNEVFAGLKFMMSELGLCQPYVMPPLSELDEQEKQRIRKAIGTCGLLN